MSTCILFRNRKTQKPQQIVRMTADRRAAIVKLFLKNKQSLVKVQCTPFVGSAVMKHCCDKLTMCCRNCTLDAPYCI